MNKREVNLIKTKVNCKIQQKFDIQLYRFDIQLRRMAKLMLCLLPLVIQSLERLLTSLFEIKALQVCIR